jgi:hypothetical protein
VDTLKLNTMENLTRYSKVNLTINGITRTFEIKWIENGLYTIFNKFVNSQKVDLNYIIKHLAD